MRATTVFVFGNPDLPGDSLPLRLLPELQKRLLDVTFEVKDPNEEWDVPEELVMIDTAQGVSKITVFDDLTKFAGVPRLTTHDFDALTNLRFLQKLGKLKKIKIIGVPPEMNKEGALKGVLAALT